MCICVQDQNHLHECTKLMIEMVQWQCYFRFVCLSGKFVIITLFRF